MCSGLNAPEMGQGRNDTDRAVAAHPEVRDVIEKQHAGNTGFIERLAQQCPDERVGTSRFVDNRGTEVVVFAVKTFEPLGQGAVAQIRRAADDDARWLTRRV